MVNIYIWLAPIDSELWSNNWSYWLWKVIIARSASLAWLIEWCRYVCPGLCLVLVFKIDWLTFIFRASIREQSNDLWLMSKQLLFWSNGWFTSHESWWDQYLVTVTFDKALYHFRALISGQSNDHWLMSKQLLFWSISRFTSHESWRDQYLVTVTSDKALYLWSHDHNRFSVITDMGSPCKAC